MKNKYSLMFAVCFLVSFAFLVASQDENPQWKGTLGEENGVKIIKNPNEPLYGEITFELEEDLSIGNDEDDNYFFYRGIDFDIDSEGNIFVFDRANFRIQKFNMEGKYLQTIGRRGQGPSEFQDIVSELYLDLEDNIYVEGKRLIQVFNKKGEFVKSIPLYTNITRFGIVGNEVILASTSSQTGKGTIYEIALLNSKGEKVKALTSILRPRVILNLKTKKPFAFSFSHPYQERLYFCVLDKNLGIYGKSSEYKLFVANSSGDTIYILEKEELPQKITKQELNKPIDRLIESYKKRDIEISRGEIEKLVNVPEFRPFFSGVLADDLGRIYVRRVASILVREKEVTYDLFSEDGYYLYKMKIPFTKGLPGGSPKFIVNGYIYRWEHDREAGLDLIKRYKINNWDQIKTGIN